MLLTKTVIMKWYSRNKTWYESKGYTYTKMGDEFEVKVEDLTDGSNVLVDAVCNGCNEILLPMAWRVYKKYIHEDNMYYCRECAKKLFNSTEKIAKTKLKNGKKSFGYWLIKNLPLKQAIEIILRWDDELNGKDIREVGFASHGFNKKGYWFKCLKHTEHKSELHNIVSFTTGKGSIACTMCNSFAQYGYDNIDNDFLSKYWDWERNEELGINPWKISYGSQKKVYLFCQEKSYHGSYCVSCNNFAKGDRCSYCCKNYKVHRFDSLGWLYPQVFDIWSKKNEKSPYEYSPWSKEEVLWNCKNEKHEDYYRGINSSNVKEFRCPECSNEMKESILQEKTRLYLESLGYNVLHEYNCILIPINPKTKYPLPFDNEIILINNKHLICECHGRQHYEELPDGHPWLNGAIPKEYLHYQRLKDRYKRFMAYKNGYEYLELPYTADNKKDTYKKLINNKMNDILIKEGETSNE